MDEQAAPNAGPTHAHQYDATALPLGMRVLAGGINTYLRAIALSSRHVDQSTQNFSATLDWGIRMVLLLGLPAMAGLFFLAEPMLMVLFMHGAFTPNDAEMASYSLMAYSAGLLSFMLVKVLATGFYSRQDTKRPVKFGIIAMVANMGLNIAFAIPFSYVGLAMATAASAALNALLLGITLYRERVLVAQPGTWSFIIRGVAAVAVMVGVVLWLTPSTQQWREMSLVARPWQLAQIIGVGAGVYLLVLMLSGLRPRHLRAQEY